MRLFQSKQPIKPLPYWVYYSAIAIIALIGLLTTLYLSYAHYRVYMDIGYKSFCAISRSINCDTVSQSSYAVLLDMPLAVWGTLGYILILILMLFGLQSDARPRRMWAMIQAIALLFCGLDLYLAWVSTSRIGSYCIMCILTYAVNFALLYFAWLIRRRFTHATFFMCLRKDIGYLRGQTIQAVSVSVAFLGIVTAGMAFYPSYWEYSIPTVQASLQTGYTAEGRPWIGARSPKLVIEEYSDYLCFQCAKMHTYLRKLVSYYPDKIRLVHSHFPMDNAYNPIVKESFHEGSGRMALLALYAESHNKFWQMNDLLFQSGRLRSPVGMRALGEKLDMDFKSMARSVTDPTLLERLRADILSGLKHRITATPSFVINGNVYQGVIPAEVLRTVINDE